jgi:Lysozyme like domain/NlpC/P60 family/Bacterial TSP3 repeat
VIGPARGLAAAGHPPYAGHVPMYTAREIYRFARMAGFSPDQSATMTAIALAESGGNSGAHNPHGEDSRGLWQINAAAHPDLRNANLYDPVENAKAAFEVSGGGRDVSAWTTTHGGSSAKYLAYRSDALAAARTAGDGGDLGVWTGTRGYGSPLAAGGGGGGGGAPFDPAFPGPGAGGAVTPGGTSAAGEEFVRDALAQAGDRYVFGAEADPNNPNPTVFDCSELTQWAAHRAGVDLPDGSWLQYQELAKEGGAMSVEQALKTRGALLFYFSQPPTGAGRPSQAHVAISLGDGRTIEARSTKDGVGIFTADTKRFNYAAAIPQFEGGGGAAAAPMPDVPLPTTPSPTGQNPLDYGPAVDTDGDGLIDGRELALGTDPTRADTDGDGLSDGYELGLHTNPLKADTDGDGIGDSVELATGTSPTSADSNHDGVLDGSTSALDSDHDGLTDELEKVLGTDPFSLDSDHDGFTDGLEYQGSFDPTDPLSTPLSNPLSSSPSDPLSDPLGPVGTGVPSASAARSTLYGSGLPGHGLGGLGSAADPAGGLDDLGVQ